MLKRIKNYFLIKKYNKKFKKLQLKHNKNI